MGRRVLVKIAAAVAVAASLALGTVSTASAAGPAAAAAPPPAASADANRGGGGGGGRVTPNSQLPSGPNGIQVDETKFKTVATLRGKGTQVYHCVDNKYVLREPVATLEDLRSGKIVGIHGFGPFWANFDGSRVNGAIKARVKPDGTPPGVDWLLLTATNPIIPPNPSGIFGQVALIQRIDTRGGLTPTQSCTTPSTIAVDYSTNYVFWAPK